MHPGLNMITVIAADGQKFDAVTELPGKINVNGLDLRDAFRGYLVETDVHAIGNGHQNNQFMGREKYEEAVAEYKKAVELNPDYRDAHIGLAATYSVLGREKEASTEVEEILRIEPNFSLKKYAKFMYFQVGLESEIEGLRKAGLPE
jgi:tetratricopeptide (TPR) repeat protein